MRVIAIDPGLTIGLAIWNSETEDFEIQQTDSVNRASDTVERWLRSQPHRVLVENYISGGHLTSEAKDTIKLVGYFEYWLRHEFGAHVDLVAPQKRLSAASQATALIGVDAKDLYRNGRDAIAALAHAIAYTRENS